MKVFFLLSSCWTLEGVYFLAICFLMETFMWDGVEVVLWRVNNFFPSILLHLTMNILKAIEVIPVLDLYYVGFTVCSTLLKPGEAYWGFGQRFPWDGTCFFSATVEGQSPSIWSLRDSLQHHCKISHRGFLTLGKLAAYLLWHCRIKQREKTEGENRGMWVLLF